MKRIGQKEIIEIATQRAILESNTAKNMYDVFNSGRWLSRLQEFAAIAIEQIIGLGSMKTVDKVLLNAALAEEDKLVVWKKGTAMPDLDGLKAVVKAYRSWTAADCSDLIRLFGAVIENKSLLKSGASGADVDDLRDGMRKGDHWRGTRDRGRKGKAKKGLSPGFKYYTTTSAPHIAAGHHAMLAGRREGPDSFAGTKGTRIQDKSTVKKIDIAFGLPEGCDISGTTADSIFFVEHVRDFCGPVLAAEGLECTDAFTRTLQLLPLATMVSQAHHTVLECALTLTLNGYITYEVGFYSSLVPHKEHETDLDNILNTAQKTAEQRKLHIFCYYEGSVLSGFRLETHDEMEKFRTKLATVNKRFLGDWRAYPLYLQTKRAEGLFAWAGIAWL